jgi:hypothetical protein
MITLGWLMRRVEEFFRTRGVALLLGEDKPAPGDPVLVTHGFSKDKRPDLKFILSLLCVEGNLPCHAGESSSQNTSDKELKKWSKSVFNKCKI